MAAERPPHHRLLGRNRRTNLKR